jgi:ketosteroid isomerase-like protein
MKTALLLGIVAVAIPTGLRPSAEAVAGDSELAGIEKLHRQDIAATLSGDLRELAALWTPDAVRLQPGRPADVGKAAILAVDERSQVRHPEGRVLTFVPEFKDVRISGGWAFEWGTFTATVQETAKSPVQTLRANFLRVLQKQSDGSWKFARVMWNEGEKPRPAAAGAQRPAQ